MVHIILLNGPPRSGKTTSADLLAQHTNGVRVSFKTELLRLMALAHPNDFTMASYEADKDNGDLRSRLIALSEDVIKPAVGADYFARAAMANILAQVRGGVSGPFIFDDGGFPEELRLCKEIFDQVTVIRLARAGCTFANDSRSFYDEGEVVFNNGDVHELAHKLERLVK